MALVGWDDPVHSRFGPSDRQRGERLTEEFLEYIDLKCRVELRFEELEDQLPFRSPHWGEGWR